MAFAMGRTPPKSQAEECERGKTKTPTKMTPPPSLTKETPEIPPSVTKYQSRITEAKAMMSKIKINLGNTRNTSKIIIKEVTEAAERLVQLVKEAERKLDAQIAQKEENESENKQIPKISVETELIKKLEEHANKLKDNSTLLEKLNRQMEKNEDSRLTTYASVTATPTAQPVPVHSIVVSSTNTDDTSDDVIAKIRTAVNAKTSGIRVDRLRKAREGKVVLGCQSKDDLAKITEQIKSGQPVLYIEAKNNKDPLVILKNVLNINTDEEILAALRKQNAHTLGKIPEGEYRAIVRYRKKARNPHECHVVLRVSPRVWQCLTFVGKVHIDLQRVQVSDQSPLLQCTKCLGYGHGKKSCVEPAEICSHCTEAHIRKDCPHLGNLGKAPKCRNCVLAKLGKNDHNAFDSECPMKKKWDRLARSCVAYC